MNHNFGFDNSELGIFQGKNGSFANVNNRVSPLRQKLNKQEMGYLADKLLLELNSQGNLSSMFNSNSSKLMLYFVENGLFSQAEAIWDQMINSSWMPTIQIISKLLKAYAKAGHFDKVSEVLAQLSARSRFNRLPEAYSLAISCFANAGQVQLMERAVQEMMLRDYEVDTTIANAFVQYYSTYGSLLEMEAAYASLKKARLLIDEDGIRAMSLAYLKQKKFYRLGEFLRDVGLRRTNVGNLLWNLLLLSYAANFKMKSLQREFLNMIKCGFHPNLTTFNVRALAFSKMSLLWDLHLTLEHMNHEHVIPDLVTCGCIVDAYLERRLGKNLDFGLKNKMNLDDSPVVLTDPFIFEVLGKGDFHLCSEAFLEFEEQNWTYKKLIAMYMKKHCRRNQIFWNY